MVNTNYSKSILHKIDWNIVTFLMRYLYHNPYEKKTNLAMKAGLQYSRFIRYLKWLQFVKWVDLRKKDGYNVIILTQTGRNICKELYTYEANSFSNMTKPSSYAL